MMSEIGKIHRGSRLPLGGEVFTNQIKYYDYKTGESIKDWFLLAFKAGDKATEAWTGFHSQNILVVVTEASGISQETFNAIEGILTGEMSRLLIVFNANENGGEAYQSTRSPLYKKHRLNCLDAPNVRAKKNLIPGQVDYEWVAEKLEKPGWVEKIEASEARPKEFFDFKFENQWYRPGNLFRIKVMGEFPAEDESQVIPLSWIEQANNRWYEMNKNRDELLAGPSLTGLDVAGMGRDKTAFAPRYGDFIDSLKLYPKQDHMDTVGKLQIYLKNENDIVNIDTIGEGAGVFSRANELNLNVVSAKFSEGADGITDETGERTFLNMRAACYWALRDRLDPKFNANLALPPDEELTEELTAIMVKGYTSTGKIQLISKEKIKEMINRSPDKGDAVALSCWPKKKDNWSGMVSLGEAR
jgi:hypothetical protein